jgi:hypothetical protein
MVGGRFLLTSSKAIGKNLIKNGVFHPIWCLDLHSSLTASSPLGYKRSRSIGISAATLLPENPAIGV